MTVGEYMEWLGAAWVTFIVLFLCGVALVNGYFSIIEMDKRSKM